MAEAVGRVDGFVLRRAGVAEALAQGDRLRAIFRDAVNAVGPAFYSAAQVAAWAGSADDTARWAERLADGVTWIAAANEAPGKPVAFAQRRPADHLDLLFTDPVFHRRGIGGALLALAAEEARREGVGALTAEASLVSYPLFVAAGYALVAREEVEHRGLMFPGARMRLVLA